MDAGVLPQRSKLRKRLTDSRNVFKGLCCIVLTQTLNQISAKWSQLQQPQLPLLKAQRAQFNLINAGALFQSFEMSSNPGYLSSTFFSKYSLQNILSSTSLSSPTSHVWLNLKDLSSWHQVATSLYIHMCTEQLPVEIEFSCDPSNVQR